MLRTDGDPELRVFDQGIRFLHWLTLFLVATIFVLAFSIGFASSNEVAVALIQLHRSFGVTVWVVTLGRLVWRQFSHFPYWPADMPQSMRLPVSLSIRVCRRLSLSVRCSQCADRGPPRHHREIFGTFVRPPMLTIPMFHPCRGHRYLPSLDKSELRLVGIKKIRSRSC
jgi:hypothetical protein